MIHRFVDFFSSARIKRDGEKGENEQNIREGVFPFGDARHLRAVENQSSFSDSKPSFRDAEEGIDVKALRIILRNKLYPADEEDVKEILKIYKKIMEVEVK